MFENELVMMIYCGYLERTLTFDEKEKVRKDILSALEFEKENCESEMLLLSKPETYFQHRDKLPYGRTMEDYEEILSSKKRSDRQKIKKLERPKNTRISVVYFLSGNGFVKIGKSSNFKDRKSWFDVMLPFKVEVTHTIKSNDIHTCEKHFHEKYADRRSNGEWFNLTAEDVAEIKLVEQMDF